MSEYKIDWRYINDPDAPDIDLSIDNLTSSLAQKAQQTDLTNLATYKEINGAIPFGTTLTALKGDGTDETSKLLALLNYVADNHLTAYIPRNMTITIDSLTVTGKSNFGIRFEGTIKRLNNSPTVGSLIKLDTCSKVSIHELNMDGNGANNGCVAGTAYTSNQEQKHSLMLTGCSDFRIDKFHVLNPCGDGIYIGNSSTNIKMFTVTGHADTQIGRNLVSIVTGQDIFIDYLYCDGIGHYEMPGGLDIETNVSTDVVRNVFVNTLDISSGGTNPLSIIGNNSSLVENIFIGRAKVTSLATGAQGSVKNFLVLSASNVHVDSLTLDGNNGVGIGISIDKNGSAANNIIIKKVIGKNCYRGIQLGFTDQASNVDITAVFTNSILDGVTLFSCKNVKLNLDIDSVGSARYMVNLAGTGTKMIDTVLISGNLSLRGTGVKAIGTSQSVTTYITNVVLDNVNFSGWAVGNMLWGAGLQAVKRKTNCINLTHQTAMPSGTTDQWVQGDIVWNIGTDTTVAFWRRLTTGTGNVLNTDWKAY